MLKGFKSFLMQGQLILIAVGLVVALAFSTLIKAFTDNIITPLVNAAGGGGATGLGVHVKGQLVNFGAFISAVIYFVIFMAVIYFVIVVPTAPTWPAAAPPSSATHHRRRAARTACPATFPSPRRSVCTAAAR